MRYLLNFSFNGNYFYGYNKQKEKKTVQGEIEKLLSKRFNKIIKITGCSRTDRNVHSLDHYAHFDVDNKIDEEKLRVFLNKSLNGEIYIKSIRKVKNDFHARYDVIKKTYLYKINTREYNPTEKDTVMQYNKSIDIKKIKRISKILTGKHSFKAFTPSSNLKESYIRTIYDIKIKREKDYVYIYITGDGFLRYMVRNIVSLFIDYNENKINLIDVIKMVEKEKKEKLGKKVIGNALYLYRVYY